MRILGWLVVLAILPTATGCIPSPLASGTFGYYLAGEEKDQPCAVDVAQQVRHRIEFTEESDPEMLKALRALKIGILYPGADGRRIYLVGELDATGARFTLNRWFITTPFYEVDLKPGHPRRAIRRQRLLPNDFYEPVDLNLAGLVVPANVHESKRWGGVGAPYDEEDFK